MERARFTYEIVDAYRLSSPALWKAVAKNPGFSWTAARVVVRSSEGPGGSVVAEILHRPLTGRTAYACGERWAWTYCYDMDDAIRDYLDFITGGPAGRPN